MSEEEKKGAALDLATIGSTVMAGASFHPKVGEIISQNPEAVSTIMSFVILMLRIFVRKKK